MFEEAGSSLLLSFVPFLYAVKRMLSQLPAAVSR